MATVILAQQNRQGTHISASILVPTVPDNTWAYFDLDISPSDLSSSKTLILGIEGSSDGGVEWYSIGGLTWQGPTVGQPSFGLPVNPYISQRVRCFLDIPVTVRVGASVSIEPWRPIPTN